MRERDNKGRFIKKGSEKAEKKSKKGGRRRDKKRKIYLNAKINKYLKK